MGTLLKWVIVTGLLVGAAITALSVDWCAYGAATPPSPPPLVSPDDVALVELLVNGSAEAHAEVAAGETVEVAGRFATEVKSWWWNPPRGLSFQQRVEYSRANSHKPYLGARADLLSRSFKAPGYIKAASQVATRKPDDAEHVSFRIEIAARQRPGRYELRLILHRRGAFDRSRESWVEHIIGSREE
jgi:hypothetical protein